jgi:L-tartrate/succinate antiporter
MTLSSVIGVQPSRAPSQAARGNWRATLLLLLPLIAVTLIAWLPAPPGLSQHSWYFRALLPIVLTLAGGIPGMPMEAAALAHCLSRLMGNLTPYGTGPSPVYAGRGYLPARDYWRLAAIFGALNLAVLLFIVLPTILLAR